RVGGAVYKMSAEKATMTERTATGIAHSKLILIGEHAVVDGQPAVAIPFPLIGVETQVEHVPGAIKLDSSFYHGPLHLVPDSLRGIAQCLERTLNYLDLPFQDLWIKIHSSILPGKGLGSSASVALSIV